MRKNILLKIFVFFLFVLIIPFSEAEETEVFQLLLIYNDGDLLNDPVKLLKIDVSSFAKMDSDGQNLDLINYGIILILIVVFFLIYKNKDRFRKEEISNTEEQLKEYIKDAKKQGQNEEEIKKELINSNWPRDL